MKPSGQLPVETHTYVSAPPTADGITGAILAYLDAHGFCAWRQPNRGEYDPTTGKWRPHPNARRGVPDIIGFRRRDATFIGVEGTQDEKPAPTACVPSRRSSSISSKLPVACPSSHTASKSSGPASNGAGCRRPQSPGLANPNRSPRR